MLHPHGHEHIHRGTEETEYFFSLLQQHGAAYRFLHLFNCLLPLHSLNQPSSRLFYFSMLSSAPLNRAPSAFGISLRPPCHSLGSFLLCLFSPLGLLLALCTLPSSPTVDRPPSLYHGTHVLINSRRRVRDVHVPLHERV